VDLGAVDHLLAALAAIGAGLVNAVAGGGTLITFPALIALGVPAVRANVTNTVALCPGYLGGTFAQRGDLAGQRARVRVLAAAAAAGGLLGSVLLLATPERIFRDIVPLLLLVACALLAFQERLRKLVPVRHVAVPGDGNPRTSPLLAGAVFVSTVYGGYFGGGLGIVVLATLSLLLDDHIVRLNALKQVISAVSNVVAAAFFVMSGRVVWSLVLVMAPAALFGGVLGGRLVRVLNPVVLRSVIVTAGVVVAIAMWL
jgi:uncharacterized protein